MKIYFLLITRTHLFTTNGEAFACQTFRRPLMFQRWETRKLLPQWTDDVRGYPRSQKDFAHGFANPLRVVPDFSIRLYHGH